VFSTLNLCSWGQLGKLYRFAALSNTASLLHYWKFRLTALRKSTALWLWNSTALDNVRWNCSFEEDWKVEMKIPRAENLILKSSFSCNKIFLLQNMTSVKLRNMTALRNFKTWKIAAANLCNLPNWGTFSISSSLMNFRFYQLINFAPANQIIVSLCGFSQSKCTAEKLWTLIRYFFNSQ